MGHPKKISHPSPAYRSSHPYRVTVFKTSTGRSRKLKASDTPNSFQDAAELARKTAFVARLRNAFLIILSTATLLYGLSVVIPRTHSYTQEGLPPLKQSLERIESVAMRHKVVGYERSKFGNDWALSPGSSCNTRHMVISSQSSSTADCTVHSPELFDPYSQSRIPTTNIEVDHIFPLSAAWDHGAYAWDDATRIRFANDPLNLVATSQALNQSKSDELPEEWLPPHPAARCWYSERVAAIAAAYSLSLSEASLTTMKRQCQLGIPFLW